jgi:hypothetical protein
MRTSATKWGGLRVDEGTIRNDVRKDSAESAEKFRADGNLRRGDAAVIAQRWLVVRACVVQCRRRANKNRASARPGRLLGPCCAGGFDEPFED